ncbi:hypothetical protein HOE67_04080 [Candidatus Peregrinibacteria bacterium]|jgi:hypothetical protein|nr:hypothetical protein [Candidatus Peregrinibacteria bacterium]MBT4056264.1 hypothetical protein [Candidatus Peregrinibacteria bacterium]
MKKFPLVATLALTAVIFSLAAPLALAADAPPGLPDPFGDAEEEAAPPSFETGGTVADPEDDPAPPSFETGGDSGSGDSGDTGSGNGGVGSTGGTSGSGGSAIILNNDDDDDETDPTPSSEAEPTTYTQSITPTTDEQAVPETGPGLGLVLIPAIAALGINLRKKK